ncbi:hypothetical protein T4E_12320 [Trichinella pseudospiralis]|uniref:Uncharacterized protein n=1 Tax=Trichinella pseudospiralis TaxID=6337 RepID=A0A0V0XZU3_TRIPS|nr:hypothetical protein T4E_12320 [Trichinella pseudospiralis]
MESENTGICLSFLARNLNEFIILVVDRVILAGFHFELLKGFLCFIARKSFSLNIRSHCDVFDVGLQFLLLFLVEILPSIGKLLLCLY